MDPSSYRGDIPKVILEPIESSHRLSQPLVMPPDNRGFRYNIEKISRMKEWHLVVPR